MNELAHRKELAIQRIRSHRELFELECVRLKEQNPLTPALALGRQALGLVQGAVSGAGSRPGGGLSAVLRSERSLLLPLALGLLRRLAKRRRKQGASGSQSLARSEGARSSDTGSRNRKSGER